MRFDLDHDWQGNMATPRARVGEKAKTHLLIALCAIWLVMGLIGHSPWKPFESQSVSIIKGLLEKDQWLLPIAVSQSSLENPPLYYWIAAGIAKVFQPLMPIHDSARFSTGLWMLVTLLMIGMSGRELWQQGVGRQTTFIFIGCLGLVIGAHTIMPEVASLTGMAMAFYALALANRRPYRAALLLGMGLAIAFLSKGLLPAIIIITSTLWLPILFQTWRTHRYGVAILLAACIAAPFLLAWPIAAWFLNPTLFQEWWLSSVFDFHHFNHLEYLYKLMWFAWPALPLAIWGFWRYRHELLIKPGFQLILLYFVNTLLWTGMIGDTNNVYALPMLIPLTVMAGGSIETIKRGAAGALNWFGLILFGLITLLIWLGWTSMMTGYPAKLKERMVFLSGLPQLDFHVVGFIFASAMTLIALFTLVRSQYTNRSAATNWAVGMTCVWSLLMTLWLPMIESARSYADVFTQLGKALPEDYACVNSHQLGSPQRDLLYYNVNIETLPLEQGHPLSCDFYLIQDEKNRHKIEPGPDWKLLWQGKRISERKESFRLYQRQSN